MIDERVLDWTCQQSNIRRSDAYRMTLAERRRLKQMRFIAGAICVCHAMLLKFVARRFLWRDYDCTVQVPEMWRRRWRRPSKLIIHFSRGRWGKTRREDTAGAAGGSEWWRWNPCEIVTNQLPDDTHTHTYLYSSCLLDSVAVW